MDPNPHFVLGRHKNSSSVIGGPNLDTKLTLPHCLIVQVLLTLLKGESEFKHVSSACIFFTESSFTDLKLPELMVCLKYVKH